MAAPVVPERTTTSRMTTVCPFCQGAVRERVCAVCGRDPTAIRRLCKHCGKMSPANEATCCHCGRAFRSDLRWKIPLIIALFIAAFILSVLIQIWAA